VSLLDKCTFEAQIAGGVRLYDASHLCPRTQKRRKVRNVDAIDRLFVHHSGALGKEGVRGALNSASYVVKKRKFPGPAYTFWVPFEALRDAEGHLVILRLNEDSERSWHTGNRANDRGVAVALQGNTSKRPLSFSHEESLEALIPWCVERYNLSMPDGLSWHSKAEGDGGRSKKACPGSNAEAWLKGYSKGARVTF